MTETLLLCVATALISGLFIQAINIKLAYKLKLLDAPTARKRHRKSTPITGGVGIFATWIFSVGIFSIFQPQWFKEYAESFGVLGACMAILVGLGIFDDKKGMGPTWKLLIEFLLAGVVIAFEPQVHAICLYWSQDLGVLIWPLALVWIVGITNSINLIDGLDGLAGGMSLLVSTSILILSIWTGDQAAFAYVSMALLIPSILAFLKYNWNPAQIFLGDNGSLPLGFFIAASSLMCRPNNKSWIMIASVILMLGYPIMDMGLAVWRRYRSGFPLFKADRNHLHFRIMRLGLSVRQTASLLLSIGFYLQITSLCLNLISPAAAAFGITVVGFSIFSLLYVIRTTERWRVEQVAKSVAEDPFNKELSKEVQVHTVAHLELEPLFEVALSEERARYRHLVHALELLVRTMVRPEDMIFSNNVRLSVVFYNSKITEEEQESLEIRFKEKISQFLELYNIQCSLAGLPMKFETTTSITRFETKFNPSQPQTATSAVSDQDQRKKAA